MDRTLWSAILLILCLAPPALTASSGKVHAQAAQPPLKGYSIVIPYPGTHEEAMAASIRGATIPLDRFTFKASKDGRSYTDVIVGQSPFAANHLPTHVKVFLVPMEIHIGSHIFDSTAPNFCGRSLGHSDLQNLLKSPIFTPVSFDGGSGRGHAAKVNGVNMGTRTYNDTHRRAEFLQKIGGPASPYGVFYDLTVAPKQVITAATSAGHSTILTGSGCSLLGGLDINFFDNYFATTVLNAVHGDPTYFVIFLMRDTVFYRGNTNDCCILGFHEARPNMQTYAPFDYDTTGTWRSPGIKNVSIAAHEIGEWLDDPLGTNPTPLWGGIGQVADCQGNWEVGDALTGTDFPPITMPDKVTYNPQETVFWSWFYSKDGDASFKIGAGGKYSMHGSFGGPSKVCPPGGTFLN